MSCQLAVCKDLAKRSENKIISDTFEKVWEKKGGFTEGNSLILHESKQGFIHYTKKKAFGKTYNKVYYLVVDKSHRRKGIATDLLNLVPKPVLYVTEDTNSAAIELCKQQGFSKVGSSLNEFAGVDIFFTKG